MKKFIAACLSILVGAFGYTLAETSIDTRVSNLEAECSSLRDVVSGLAQLHDITATEPGTNAPTTEPLTTAIFSENMNESEFVAFINAETAEIARSGQYTAVRECVYTSPIDVGGATGILDGMVQSIDETSSLEKAVGAFLGIGVNEADIPDSEFKNDYKIKSTSLVNGDLADFKLENGKYTFTLYDAVNPSKTGSTPLNRFTDDFITQDEVADSIENYTTAIRVDSTTFRYDNIKVEVTVDGGKIVNIRYSYSFDAQVTVKAGIKMSGTCAAVTTVEYSSISY